MHNLNIKIKRSCFANINLWSNNKYYSYENYLCYNKRKRIAFISREDYIMCISILHMLDFMLLAFVNNNKGFVGLFLVF